MVVAVVVVGWGGGSGSGNTPLCPGHKAYVNVKPLADSYLPWQKHRWYTLHGSKHLKINRN